MFSSFFTYPRPNVCLVGAGGVSEAAVAVRNGTTTSAAEPAPCPIPGRVV